MESSFHVHVEQGVAYAYFEVFIVSKADLMIDQHGVEAKVGVVLVRLLDECGVSIFELQRLHLGQLVDGNLFKVEHILPTGGDIDCFILCEVTVNEPD